MTSRRGKRAEAGVTSTAEPSQPAPIKVDRPSALAGLTPPQFTALVCTSLAITHILDIHRAMRDGIETTNYCSRNFLPKPEGTEFVPCTLSEMALLTLRYHMIIIRIALCVTCAILCWGNDLLLQSYNQMYGLCPLLATVCGFLMNSHAIDGHEMYSLGALGVLIFTSSRKGYQSRRPTKVFGEGAFNVVLFLLGTVLSYVITAHFQFGPKEFTTLAAEDITESGEATWFMMLFVDYTTVMIVFMFALLFFDEGRKRALLFFAGILTLIYATVQLPSEKEIWVDGRNRQNIAMGCVFCMMMGVVLPKFDSFEIKK